MKPSAIKMPQDDSRRRDLSHGIRISISSNHGIGNGGVGNRSNAWPIDWNAGLTAGYDLGSPNPEITVTGHPQDGPSGRNSDTRQSVLSAGRNANCYSGDAIDVMFLVD